MECKTKKQLIEEITVILNPPKCAAVTVARKLNRLSIETLSQNIQNLKTRKG